MSKTTLFIFGSLGLLIALIALLLADGKEAATSKELTLYCAAGLKTPVDKIIAEYQESYDTRIKVQYAGSGTLLNNLQIQKMGDLYIPADESYVKIAEEKDLIAEVIPIATQLPVIATSKENPMNITSVEDLARSDIRVSLANPEAASVGKMTQELLEQINLWDKIHENVVANGVFKPTVNEVANDVKIGAVDAAIIWDSTANQYDELIHHPLKGNESFIADAACTILTSCTQPTEALHFARFLTAKNKGLKHFESSGFTPANGDTWAEVPELTYYSGGVNRIAIENTLKEFSDREGIKINTIYNGCGILLGQIKTGGRPDLYHTCDITFMEGVEDLFLEAEMISKTDIVMLTPKGNPKNIQTLQDLTQDDLQLGLCNEEQSTLGTLSAIILREQNLYDEVQKNVRVTTPTADMLVNQVDVGKLDVALVYLANTVNVTDTCDIIPIPLDNAMAIQTLAIAQQTQFPNLANRLHDVLYSVESKYQFLNSGFEWMQGAETQ